MLNTLLILDLSIKLMIISGVKLKLLFELIKSITGLFDFSNN